MKSHLRISVLLLVLVLPACSRVGSDDGSECPQEGEKFETAMLYIEHNATDLDTGVHGNFGGEAWKRLCIWNPAGDLLLVTAPNGSLGDLGVADLFFESREPPNDEYSVEGLFGDFPEGDYLVGGIGHDGVARVATATFTHAVPTAPTITAPALGEDEEAANEIIVERSGLIVSWEPVTETIAGEAVDITSYQVIITKVDHDDPNGFSRPVYDVHLGPDATTLSVAEEFLEPETLYELEVLAIEVSGNQTIGLGFFTTS